MMYFFSANLNALPGDQDPDPVPPSESVFALTASGELYVFIHDAPLHMAHRTIWSYT